MSTVTIICVTNVVLLGVAIMMPRQYTASAELRFDTTLPAYQEAVARTQSALQVAAEPMLASMHVSTQGSNLSLSYSAQSPGAAFDHINAALASLAQREAALFRNNRAEREKRLAADAEVSATQRDRTRQRLDAALLALPLGGETAVAARIGKLQGELDALDLDIRESASLRERLNTRLHSILADVKQVEALLARPGIEAGAPDDSAAKQLAAARTRLTTTLLPDQHQLQRQLADLADEFAGKQRRRDDLAKLLRAASVESSSLQEENLTIRELQRDYDNAEALSRQLEVRLQEARLEAQLRATPELPFELTLKPAWPRRPDGTPGWLIAVWALLGSILIGITRLVVRIIMDKNVRLAETIEAEIEVPVLVDEPFAGIDPLSIGDIRALVKDLKQRGIGVLITDHNVRETLDIVDRACIIYGGQVLFAGSPEDLVADANVRRLYLGEGFTLCRFISGPNNPSV